MNQDTVAGEHAEQSPVPMASKSFSCTACGVSFQNGQEQRIHMKEPWHVNNIKRRLESLPPIPLDAFVPQTEKKTVVSKAPTHRRVDISSSDEENASDREIHQDSWHFQCLFCNQGFASDDIGFAANLEHMQDAHGWSNPDQDLVIDMQSFIGYLATEVRAWHECLYCGATKPSTASVQSHMRDKGHCLLNLDREPELLDFWETPRSMGQTYDDDVNVPEQQRPTNLSETEMRFASGKVIGSRHAAPTTKRAFRGHDLAASTATALNAESDDAGSLPLPEEPQLSSSRQLAPREELSLQGISLQQRQALTLVTKKAQRNEAVARRAREWISAKGANMQKYDQVDTKMKMGSRITSCNPDRWAISPNSHQHATMNAAHRNTQDIAVNGAK